MSLSHSPQIVTDGLVLCLDAANPRSYPKSGTTWSDLAGSNDGTMQNMTVANYSDEKRGALSFDGVDEKVSCGYFLSDSQSALSICVWFKPSYVPSGSQKAFRLVSRFTGTGSTAGTVVLDTSDGLGNGHGARFLISNSSNITYQAYVGSVLETEWLYYVGTFSQVDSKIKIYKNAEELTSTSTSGPIGAYNYPWTIGEDNTAVSDQEWFNGNISNVSIYNRALTADEVRQNYNATKRRFK